MYAHIRQYESSLVTWKLVHSKRHQYQRSRLPANTRTTGNNRTPENPCCFPSMTTTLRNHPRCVRQCRRPAVGFVFVFYFGFDLSGGWSWPWQMIGIGCAACRGSKRSPFRARNDLQLRTMYPFRTCKNFHQPGESW
jgi:hypothetical protein